MLGIRVAIGILGVFDMFMFSYVVFELLVDWSATAVISGELGYVYVIFIKLIHLRTIAAAGLICASLSDSRIHARISCHPWLCFSWTFVYIQAFMTYFVFHHFGVNIYTIAFIIDLFYRALAVNLVTRFLKSLGRKRAIIIKPDRASTAKPKVPRNTFMA